MSVGVFRKKNTTKTKFYALIKISSTSCLSLCYLQQCLSSIFCLRKTLQMEKFAHFYCVCPMFILRRLCTCTSNRGHIHTHTQCYTRTALPPPCHLLALPPCLFLFISLSLSFLLFPQCAVQSSVVEDVWPLTIHCGQGDTVHWIFFFFFAQHNATCVALQ